MAITQISKIQNRSGNLVDLPQLSTGELGFATDTKQLFIGNDGVTQTIPNAPNTFVVANVVTNLFTYNNHGFINGQTVSFSNIGGPNGINNISTLTKYYISNSTTNTFRIANSTRVLVDLTGNTSNVTLSSLPDNTEVLTVFSSIPAVGANTQVQYNNNGVLGASANFTFNSDTSTVVGYNITATNNLGTNTLSVARDASITGNLVVAGNVFFTDLETIVVSDPVIQIGNPGKYPNGAPYTTPGDRGVLMYIPNGSSNSLSFMGYVNNDSYNGVPVGNSFIMKDNVAYGNGNITGGTYANLHVGNLRLEGSISGTIQAPGGVLANTQLIFNRQGNSGNAANFRYYDVFSGGRSLIEINGDLTVNNGVITANNIQNGTSNIAIANGGNISFSVGGASNSVVVTSAGLSVPGTANITTLQVSGNANVGNLITPGIVQATGNVIGANITTTGQVTATGNITGGNLIANGAVVTSNISTPSSLNVIGNVLPSVNNTYDVGSTTNRWRNIYTMGPVYIGGQSQDWSIRTFSNGTITFTSTGTGSLFTVSGADAGSTTLTVNNISSGGNISSANATFSLANIATANLTTATVAGNLSVASNSISGNLTVNNFTQTNRLNVVGNANVGGSLYSTGNITTAGYFIGNFEGNITGNIAVPGSNTQVLFNNQGNVGATAGFTFDSVSNALVISGTIDAGGDVATNGNVSALNLITTGSVRANSGTVSTNQVTANSVSTGNLSVTLSAGVTGNVTAGNVYANSGTIGASLLTGTLTTASQPNITSVGTLSSLNVNGTSNLGVVGNVTITGGASGQVLTTNGSGVLTWSTVTTGTSTSIVSGSSNVSIPAPSGVVSTSVGGTPNVFVVSGTGANLSGNLSVTSNLSVGPSVGFGPWIINVSSSGNLLFTLPGQSTEPSMVLTTDGDLLISGNVVSGATTAGS